MDPVRRIDVYVLCWPTGVALYLWSLAGRPLNGIVALLLSWRLCEILLVQIDNYVPMRKKDYDYQHYLSVKSFPRIILLFLVNVGEVVLYFAAFYLRYNVAFKELGRDATALDAVYRSASVLISGGGLTPVQPIGKWLILGQFATFLILLVVAGPAAISAVTVKEERWN